MFDGGSLKASTKAMSTVSESSYKERRCELSDVAWIADAPMFIDERQVERFFDAVVRPKFEHISTTEENLEEKKQRDFYDKERKKENKDQNMNDCPEFEKTIITLSIGNGSKSFSKIQFSKFVREINSLIKAVD